MGIMLLPWRQDLRLFWDGCSPEAPVVRTDHRLKEKTEGLGDQTYVWRVIVMTFFFLSVIVLSFLTLAESAEGIPGFALPIVSYLTTKDAYGD
jgi:hypothetical protein